VQVSAIMIAVGHGEPVHAYGGMERAPTQFRKQANTSGGYATEARQDIRVISV